MIFSLGERSRNNLAGVHPDLVRIVQGAIVSSTVDFGITEHAVRTAEEQKKKFDQGYSQKDGYIHKSNHQAWPDGLGHAVDLTPYLNSSYLVDNRAWLYYPAIASAMSRSARALGLANRLTWGCNWLEPMSQYGSTETDCADEIAKARKAKRFTDGGHFQIT